MQSSAPPAAAHEQPQHAGNIAHTPCPPENSDARKNVPLEVEIWLSAMGVDAREKGVAVVTDGHVRGNHRNGGCQRKLNKKHTSKTIHAFLQEALREI